jgi:(1->4)-alpha-D-glucan 1-alpha-D-glucosylmutase
MVDPDNRRPVNYDLRRQLIDSLPDPLSTDARVPAELTTALFENIHSGLAKLFMTQKTLHIRKQQSLLFQKGRYLPLKVVGSKSDHICAFAREYDGRSIIVAAPRLCAVLLGDNFDSPSNPSLWEDTALEIPFTEKVCFHRAFTGDCVPVEHRDGKQFLPAAKVFGNFPAALLLSEP